MSFQDNRCVFPGQQVCLSRTTGVLLRDSKNEGCAFPGGLKNKAFQDRCVFPGQQVCFYGSHEGLLGDCSELSILLQTLPPLDRKKRDKRRGNLPSELVAIIVVSFRILYARSHSYLLWPSFAFLRDGKRCNGALSVSTLRRVESLIVWEPSFVVTETERCTFTGKLKGRQGVLSFIDFTHLS